MREEEEEAERKVGHVDFSSVRLEKCSGLRRGRLAAPTVSRYKTTTKNVPFPAFPTLNKHRCVCK